MASLAPEASEQARKTRSYDINGHNLPRLPSEFRIGAEQLWQRGICVVFIEGSIGVGKTSAMTDFSQKHIKKTDNYRFRTHGVDLESDLDQLKCWPRVRK